MRLDRRPCITAAVFAGAVVAATAHASIPPDLDLVTFASGLDAPVALRHAGDGSGRVYVVQQGGQVVAMSSAGATLGTVLDVTSDAPPHGFTTGNERGLLGLAFHPDWPADARMFVYYTDANGDSVIASYQVSGDPPAAATASAAVVLRVDQDFSNHNGGDLHFGPDGYLYISLGDGGDGGDPCGRAQTLAVGSLNTSGVCSPDANFTGDAPDSLALLGKLLRIDVDADTAAGSNGVCGGNADGSANYGIPAGNPFAGGGTANGCDEVWHYGLRNPFRFSFDRATGDLFIGDVGQGLWEEIDFSSAGAGGLNFGWDLCEGDHPYPPASGACTAPGTVPPILEYQNNPTSNCAVSGGFRYRGLIATLRGHYVYGDYCSGRIWIATEAAAGEWTTVEWRDTSLNVSGFGEDEAGDLYAISLGGTIQRFVAPDAIFADGFEP